MPNRILVIEDDEATRYAYERALQAAGYQTAGFETYFAAALEIDAGAGALLLVDLLLPPGTPQGLAVARMARHHRPGLPIIFVTGSSEMAALADGETGPIMLKPIDLGVLVTTVRELLAGSHTDPA
jgi:DNA-binding response OmpR family regulator